MSSTHVNILNCVIEIGAQPPPKREVVDGVPDHAANFMRSLWDLDYVVHAHGVSIVNKPAPQEDKTSDSPMDMVRDRETVFLRAAVTLLCAAWEAYVEDLAHAALSHLVKHTKDPDNLPLPLRKRIAKGIKESKHDLSPWSLSGEAWRAVVLAAFKADVEGLHSPKSGKIRQLYLDWLGVEDITECWTWEYFPAESVRGLIDWFVEARGAVAHGRRPDHGMSVNLLAYWQCIIVECAFRMNNNVNDKLTQLTGTEFWGHLRQTVDWKLFTKEAT